MRFRNLLPCLLTVLLVLGALQAQTVPQKPVKPADVSGVWELTTQGTPQGDMTADATFAQEADKIKFTMAGPGGFEMAGEGTVKGQDLEWTVVISTPQGDLSLTYKGKVDGETMSGEVQAGDFGAFPWTAKKKK
ncbi:MAG: hypothetical protein ACXW3H_02880 [Candidatus Aminicenantales bacterium]